MMDKNVLVDTYINLLIRVTGVPVNSTVVQISQTDFVENFPFNRLINTETFQFNSQNRTVQLQFILDELIRQMNEEHLEKMSDLTCVLEDSVWGMFKDGVSTNSNVLASGYNTSYAKFKKPRGASNIISFLQIDHYNQAGVFQDNSPVSDATTDYWLVSLQIHTVEPLIGLSPLNYENGSLVKGGIIGLNQLNLNIVTDESCSRIFSTANTTTGASALTSYITSISMGLQPNAGGAPVVNLTQLTTTSFGFANPQLLIKFCTPSSYQIKNMGDLGNYHPFKDYSNTFRSTLTQIGAGVTTQVQSNSIQLGTNPSRMFMFVRLPVTTTAYWNYAKTYFAITACDITYGNKSGILSSANQAELYRLSKKNGSKQSFEEFSGYVLVY
jgi:hypothetical protein